MPSAGAPAKLHLLRCPYKRQNALQGDVVFLYLFDFHGLHHLKQFGTDGNGGDPLLAFVFVEKFVNRTVLGGGESGQKGHVSAARFLRSLVFGNVLEINVLERDWTGWLHAIVTRVGNGTSVNAAMVANGYSWVHPQKCNTAACGEWKAFESMARKYKLGIWSGYDLAPPWEFKREGD